MFMATPVLPVTLPSAAAMPATVKAALPALTLILVNGALDLVAASLILIAGWTLSRWLAAGCAKCWKAPAILTKP